MDLELIIVIFVQEVHIMMNTINMDVLYKKYKLIHKNKYILQKFYKNKKLIDFIKNVQIL